jgi:hypothetical protein
MFPHLGLSVEAFELRHGLADHMRNVIRNGANTGKLVCLRFLKQPDVRLERGFSTQNTDEAVFSGYESWQDGESQSSFDSRELCSHRMGADCEIGCGSHVLQPLSQGQESKTALPTDQPVS